MQEPEGRGLFGGREYGIRFIIWPNWPKTQVVHLLCTNSL